MRTLACNFCYVQTYVLEVASTSTVLYYLESREVIHNNNIVSVLRYFVNRRNPVGHSNGQKDLDAGTLRGPRKPPPPKGVRSNQCACESRKRPFLQYSNYAYEETLRGRAPLTEKNPTMTLPILDATTPKLERQHPMKTSNIVPRSLQLPPWRNPPKRWI